MCRVSIFCCGCSLTAGAITAAVLQSLYTIGVVGLGAQLLAIASWLVSDNPESDRTIFGAFVCTSLNIQSQSTNTLESRVELRKSWTESREEREAAAYWLQVVGAITLTIAAISLVIVVCLVVGIMKRISCLVMPWLVGNMIKIVLSCILGLLFLMVSFMLSPIFFAPLAFEIYLWIVMLNYYRELEAPTYQPAVAYKA